MVHAACECDELLETERVELVGFDAKPVADSLPNDTAAWNPAWSIGLQACAQPGEMHPQRRVHTRRGLVRPEALDNHVDRNHLVGASKNTASSQIRQEDRPRLRPPAEAAATLHSPLVGPELGTPRRPLRVVFSRAPRPSSVDSAPNPMTPRVPGVALPSAIMTLVSASTRRGRGEAPQAVVDDPADEPLDDLQDPRALFRVRVLRAARRALAEKGLGLSMDEIANAAGVGRRRPFRHFASRDTLIADVCFLEAVDDYHRGPSWTPTRQSAAPPSSPGSSASDLTVPRNRDRNRAGVLATHRRQRRRPSPRRSWR